MTDTTWRGVPLLESGDGILEGLALLANNLNVGIPVASVAAARTLLTQAETDDVAPTSSNPAMFLVGEGVKRVLYTSDGSKSNGAWVLSPVNEVERFEGAYTKGEKFTRGANQQNALITSTIPTRNYDRVFMAWGMAAADCTAGSYNLCLLIKNTDGQLGRWNSGDALASVGTFNMMTVYAGEDPQVILAVRAGTASSNTIQMNNNGAANKLSVLAFPVTMA